jgi:hypothetical protein
MFIMSVTPRNAENPQARMWTGWQGAAASPTPDQDIWGAQIVGKVIKSATVSQDIEGVMPRGSILTVDPASSKCVLATDAADPNLVGVLVHDLVFTADETGNNIIDQTGAIAKSGVFRMDALVCGAPATVPQFEAPLRIKGIYCEGASIYPATGP